MKKLSVPIAEKYLVCMENGIYCILDLDDLLDHTTTIPLIVEIVVLLKSNFSEDFLRYSPLLHFHLLLHLHHLSDFQHQGPDGH